MRNVVNYLMLMLLVMTMLSGCIWPWWRDGGHGDEHVGGHGGGRGGEYRGGPGGEHDERR